MPSVIMLSVIMLNVTYKSQMLSVFMLSVIMPSVIMLNVPFKSQMLSVFMLSVIMLSVMLMRSMTTALNHAINCQVLEIQTDGHLVCQVTKTNQRLTRFFNLSLQQWKGINNKQSTMWQHLSQLKASAFFSLQICFSCFEKSSLYLGLVLPSGS